MTTTDRSPAVTLSDDDRAQIRARAEAATPGPWETWSNQHGQWVARLTGSRRARYPAHAAVFGTVSYDPDESRAEASRDAEHIAGMDPATTLALLDERDNLAAEVERLRTVLVDLRDRGLRFDLVPTRRPFDEAFWHDYIQRMDRSARNRAVTALQGDPTGNTATTDPT